MDSRIAKLIEAEAKHQGIKIRPSFGSYLDKYTDTFFPRHSSADKNVIHLYLSEAAMSMARREKERILEKATGQKAVWLFHQPKDLSDPCKRAGEFALRMEKERTAKVQTKRRITARAEAGLLNQRFAAHLQAKSAAHQGHRVQ